MSHFTITLVTKFLKVVEIFTLTSLYIHNLLLCCCNTETNTGPKCFSLLFCHWDLNGVTAQNFHNSLLQSYSTQHDFDQAFLSEAFINFSSENAHDWLKIDGFNLIRSDQFSSSREDAVCIHYKEHSSWKDRGSVKSK